jgi:hypothetical protein
MKLFLDDTRIPKDVQLYDADWIVVRSYEEAVDFVEAFGFPEWVSLDHDLGTEKTGLDFAHFLVDLDLDRNVMPNNFSFTVHSANPVGVKNITGLLDGYLRWKREAHGNPETTD